jgi:hypothetical protein
MINSYRIKFDRWTNGPQAEPFRSVVWQPFRLRVFSADGVYQFTFRVFHAEVPTGLKLDALNRRCGPAEIEAAIIRWAISEVESRLRSGVLPAAGTHKVEELELGESHLPLIEQFTEQKMCGYQIARGKELFCSAAAPDDKTADPSSGLAPTSRPICKKCDLPDDEYRCSHLTHPLVIGTQEMGEAGRRVISALCEINSPHIKMPSLCHAGGHDCWEYIVEPSGEARKIGFTVR